MSTIEHEVATVEQSHAVTVSNPLDMDIAVFSAALSRRGENRRALMQWVRESLVEGVDYGRIHTMSKRYREGREHCQDRNCTYEKNPHHWSKHCLYKPGSEKIVGMLGCTATFPTLGDYEKAALTGVELKQLILRCHMLDPAGRIVSDGIGARSLDQDYGDINKALKMAAKSAMIDATLRMAGLSEVFTQDLDVMQAEKEAREAKGQTPAEAAADKPPESAPDPNLVPAGKHRGKKWIEVAEDYLNWCVNAGKAPEALKAGAQKELERRDFERTKGIDGDEKIPH